MPVGGAFAFDGLWPGEWVLSGHPWNASGSGEVAVTIGEGDIELVRTVELAPPR